MATDHLTPAPIPNHPRFRNLTGRTFGKWKVVAYAGRTADRRALWFCQCRCGAVRPVQAGNLLGDGSHGCLSCRPRTRGCYRHGHKRGNGTPTYASWHAMLSRCLNPNAHAYENYGGRGITVCDRWQGPNGFANFLADMGERPDGRSIDRIDNDGDYTPANCRWATRGEQSRNRRSKRTITFRGETRTLKEWAVHLRVPYDRLKDRLRAGRPVEEAFTAPPRRTGRPKNHRHSNT